MKVRELRTILSKYPDDMDINYEDPNYGGRGAYFIESDINEVAISQMFRDGPHQLLIRCPFWEEVD